MGEMNRLANIGQLRKQPPFRDGSTVAVSTGPVRLVKRADGRLKTDTVNELHRIKRPAVEMSSSAVNGNNSGVLQFASDQRFLLKSTSARLVVSVAILDFFQRDFA